MTLGPPDPEVAPEEVVGVESSSLLQELNAIIEIIIIDKYYIISMSSSNVKYCSHTPNYE